MTRKSVIGFVTCATLPALTADDAPLIGDIRDAGANAVAVTWNDPSVSWRDFDLLVLRSCWDYHCHLQSFVSWLQTIERLGVDIVNPLDVVRWNLHKRYLTRLAERGVLVPESIIVERGASVRLASILRSRGWIEAIVKPTISASATGTWRTKNSRDAENRFHAENAKADLIVQRFVPEIVDLGEWSLVFIDGRFSHAVLKRAAPTEFRVQSEFGGSADAQTPDDSLVEWALGVSEHIPGEWLYARVDAVVTPRGFVLMELECIEPELFFGERPAARRHIARLLVQRVALNKHRAANTWRLSGRFRTSG